MNAASIFGHPEAKVERYEGKERTGKCVVKEVGM